MLEKTTTDSTALAQSDDLNTRQPERFLVPTVDIHETDDSLSVIADVPGIATDGLDVSIHDDILTIRGQVNETEDDQGTATGGMTEFRLASYHRQFRLGEQIDRSRIKAQLSNGVVTVTLPKLDKAKPKKIEVTVR